MQARAIAESDWKVLRGLRDAALDRLCSRALDAVARESRRPSRPYDRFMKVFSAVDDGNDQIARIFDPLRRSTAYVGIAALRREGLITDAEFSLFSADVREVVRVFDRT